MSKRILIVEDEPGIVLTLTDRLQSDGFHVETADDGETGLERASTEPFDLILLDVMLPKKSGLDVCRDLRQRGITTPIIMLTARGLITDKVIGLKLGADDYVTKPFEVMELSARIEALFRRAASTPGDSHDVYQFGSIRVDFRRTEVTRKGKPVE